VKRTKKTGSAPIRLRSGRVVLIRSREQYLGNVEAPSLEAAESEAAKQLGLTAFQRRRPSAPGARVMLAVVPCRACGGMSGVAVLRQIGPIADTLSVHQ
jgi:hypothetical protein